MLDKPIYVYNWKDFAIRHPDGYYELQTADTGEVPVRLFFTPALLAEAVPSTQSAIPRST